MQVVVHHTIDTFAADLAAKPAEVARGLSGVVREGARVGNTVAKDYARVSAGSHGKHYHKAFTVDVNPTVSLVGAFVYSAEYGPDAALPQGNMEFEYGSRNQKPHLDLNRSADLIGPSLAQEVRGVLDRVFW